MQISKLIALTGTVVFYAGSISVQAADTDNAAQAAARAAVLAAMQTGANTVPVAAQPVAAPAAPAPVQPIVVAPVAVTANSTGTNNAAQAAALAAVLAALQNNNTTANSAHTTLAQPAVVAPASVAPVAAAANSTGANSAAQEAALTAVLTALQNNNPGHAALPLPISASVADKLQALNAKYMADQIAPADYFAQREALLKN